MDVTTVEEAVVAEESGAVSVMVLDTVPADIIKANKVARMASLDKILRIKASVSIPVMAKVRIGHLIEAKILQEAGVDYIDESEVLTPADSEYLENKKDFTTPFVCGVTDLISCILRICEGASMLRSKGRAGTGNVYEATKHLKKIKCEIQEVVRKIGDQRTTGNLTTIHPHDELINTLKSKIKERSLVGDLNYEIVLPQIVRDIARTERLPVVLFAAGGIATPADAALMRYYGADGVFVGSGIFKSQNPDKLARAIVEATSDWKNYSAMIANMKNIKHFM